MRQNKPVLRLMIPLNAPCVMQRNGRREAQGSVSPVICEVFGSKVIRMGHTRTSTPGEDG